MVNTHPGLHIAENSEPALRLLARHIAEAPQMPDAATKDLIRDAIVDVLGCILVGQRQPVARDALNALGSDAGPATVLGLECKLTAPAAAFVNGVAGHSLDFDDWEVPGNTHPTAVLVPAILAASAGLPLSGTAMIEAYLVGFEVIARLGEAMNFEHYDGGWHSTNTLGAIGAAAAVARLKGLDAERACHALSLAVSRASGLTCQFGSDAKPVQAGFAAEAGVTAARLAEAGLTGQSHALDAPTGLIALSGGAVSDRLKAALEKMKDGLALTEHGLVFKPYPSCGYTHRTVDAARQIHDRGGFALDEIDRVEIYLPDFHAQILPFRAPQDVREARFSLPFCAAIALESGGLRLSDFEDQRWRNPVIATLIEATSVYPTKPKNPLLNYDAEQPDRLVLRLKGGRELSAEVAFPLGAPETPMSSDMILEKFLANTEGMIAEDCALDRLEGWTDAEDVHPILNAWRLPQ